MLIRLKDDRKTNVFTKDCPITEKTSATIKQTEWKVENRRWKMSPGNGKLKEKESAKFTDSLQSGNIQ